MHEKTSVWIAEWDAPGLEEMYGRHILVGAYLTPEEALKATFESIGDLVEIPAMPNEEAEAKMMNDIKAQDYRSFRKLSYYAGIPDWGTEFFIKLTNIDFHKKADASLLFERED